MSACHLALVLALTISAWLPPGTAHGIAAFYEQVFAALHRTAAPHGPNPAYDS